METQQEAELDLISLLLHLRKKLWLIIAVTVVAALIGYVGSKMLTTPFYTATTQVYVYQQDLEGIDYSNLTVASQLRRDCAIIIKSESVTREVVELLDLPINPKALGKAIRIDTEENTRILKISYTDVDPERATLIVNTVREVAARRTAEVMQIDVLRTLFEASLPQAETTTNIRKSTMIAGGVGFVGIVSLLIIFFLLDDTIRTEDDVQAYLGLSTLAIIPLSDDLQVNRSKRNPVAKTLSANRKQRR